MKNVLEFQNRKTHSEKITMVTCYDYSFAKILDPTTVDALLVGDSLAQVIHGHSDTLAATVDMMALHTRAVRRGTQKLIVSDMPFLSTRKGLRATMDAVHALMTAGANAIKIEGLRGHEKLIQHIVDSGVPVMGHLGLTPQSIHQFGGPKIQGRNEPQAEQILSEAMQLEKLGCFSLVLECIPAILAKKITDKIKIPTIGIGAGINCDGQILVLQDMLGMSSEFNPKFLKKYADLSSAVEKAMHEYVKDVKSKNFPTKENSYE